MAEPEEELKKFEESLRKPKTTGVKKDRIVTCPGCGRKQTMMQVVIGGEVKCRKCGASFELKREHAEDAHLVTMAAVDLQVKQMEFMERVGKVPPPPKKKITLSQKFPEKSFVAPALLTLVLYLLWPVGFVLNAVFLAKARRHAAATGRPPAGTTLLGLWFFLLGILPLALAAVVLVLGITGALDLAPWLDKIKNLLPKSFLPAFPHWAG
jgi:transcription elongation factor Elf1